MDNTKFSIAMPASVEIGDIITPYTLRWDTCSGQQVKGGDSAPLLCCGETPLGVLRPALEPPVQERHGPVGVGPGEGHKNDPRPETPLL